MALLTASRFGLPESLLARAEELSQDFNDYGSTSLISLPTRMDSSQINVRELLESAAGTTARKSVFIPPGYTPPPSLEGQSCVYILELGKLGNYSYYVGETDSLVRRLSQHRSKGGDWKSASAVAIQVESGKSSARSLESKVIKTMAREGLDLISISDGTSIRPRSDVAT